MEKLTLYLKSGHTISFECKEWKFDYDNETLEFAGYKFVGIQEHKKVSIVPNQIAAYVVD